MLGLTAPLAAGAAKLTESDASAVREIVEQE
jgi:hypothetical protein